MPPPPHRLGDRPRATVDPQLGQSPAASLLKVVEQKPIAEIDDQTLVMADVGRKAITQVKEAARDLLQRRMPAEQAEVVAEKLSTGTWTHDYPICASTAKMFSISRSGAYSAPLPLLPRPRRSTNGPRSGWRWG